MGKLDGRVAPVNRSGRGCVVVPPADDAGHLTGQGLHPSGGRVMS